MSKFNFTEYMHNVAVNLKEVSHIDDDPNNHRFFRASSVANVEEIIQALPEFKGFALVVEDNEEGNYMHNTSGTIFDNQMCGFFMLSKAANLDAVDRGLKIKHAELVMRKIISKLRKDYNTDNAGKTDIGLRNIDWDSLRYFSFGPVIDNCYGVYCNFGNPTLQTYIFNTDDWNE